jgi:hypothetical protein
LEDFDIEELLLRAKHSRNAQVFEYSWEHTKGDKEGKLRFFFLKIDNLAEIVGNDKISMKVSTCIGARCFTLNGGELPKAGSQRFLVDSREAIETATLNKKDIILFPAVARYTD